ncbi:hypothetical protein LSTR_LSTR005197 [Laodelphax striatellus]|uniref:Homeobox domain-containing protein n=1 Tax=Laodelphax striatellus TaxID=195883 RepID=A0A482XNZ5_LAOST|nr:hypothetical protein LSTR_LSTR005197 [Laodelphax striatellus]
MIPNPTHARVQTITHFLPFTTTFPLKRKVWFQNQRAKMKKIQKKQRLEPKNSGKDSDGGDDIKNDKPKMKEEEASPCSGGAGGFVNDSCSDTEGAHGLDGPGEAHFKGHHDDPFYKDMIDADGVGPPRQFLHSGENFIGVQGFCGSGGENMTGASLNPIDRLYSMQNSYFCGEEQLLDQ